MPLQGRAKPRGTFASPGISAVTVTTAAHCGVRTVISMLHTGERSYRCLRLPVSMWLSESPMVSICPSSCLACGLESRITFKLEILHVILTWLLKKNCCEITPVCHDQCSSVGWASSFSKAKGHWFDSQCRHVPGLWDQSPVGACTGGDLSRIDISLPLFPLSKNK